MERTFDHSSFLLDVPRWLFVMWPGPKRKEILSRQVEPLENKGSEKTDCQRAKNPGESFE